MKKWKAIVCVNQNGGIGRQGKLLYHIHADLRRFHDLTVSQRVIYGHQTLHTFPHQQALASRENIILSHELNLNRDNAIIIHSITELTAYLEETEDDREVFVIGGESVYRQLLPYCDTIYMTVVMDRQKADAFFPPLDETWKKVQASAMQQEGEYRFLFEVWKKNL